MEFKIETLQPVRIVYVRRRGVYGPENAKAMEQLKAWARERGLLTEAAVLYGMPLDHPQAVSAEQCRYDACIVTGEPIGAEEGVFERRFEGGTYAVFRVPHTAEGMQAAWAAAFPALQKAGCRLSDQPAVERYAGTQLLQGFCELCVPIEADGV
ncbi:AraC family transcriptional regulator [Saccharibacillus alkalitolerans]|uniref:DNA gyrase inhibitor n=1 Tax=Saccharibacillus alkalitolerans TaxID=2705290 RepID=A0ABX0F2Z4_9BACL|nr:GyrI-like domain-containing protein [Saccharibacillus alkalitolerans]NGZ74840.1 DNA gyrase inhibitor [Saccharibacillus alkalitolerans]